MKPIFTMAKDALPPKDNLLAVLCFGFDLKAATFDGCNFYDKETGGQLAIGSVKAWVDLSGTQNCDLPLVFGNLHAYTGILKSLSECIGGAK